MASIKSLLNPMPDESQAKYCSLPSPALTTVTSPPSSRPKKQKLAKDAAIFTRDKTRGKLRYSPCEDRDEELTRRHREFQLYPMGNIADFPRHIPYNSDKKSFQEKTGRESFEVFQYTFKIPGVDKEWMIMWDYNIGLVRTTHLFKSQNYSKTTPAKMLDANPGLREICHSITGGAIVAQGYWMPFDVAKAIAATFCWRIRHALTPIFGLDFPSLCIHPQDRTRRFGQMIIDPSIVKKATETANFYRLLEYRSPAVSSISLQPTRTAPAFGDEGEDPEDPEDPTNETYTSLPRRPREDLLDVNEPPRDDEGEEDSESSSSTLFSSTSGTATDCLSERNDDEEEEEEEEEEEDATSDDSEGEIRVRKKQDQKLKRKKKSSKKELGLEVEGKGSSTGSTATITTTPKSKKIAILTTSVGSAAGKRKCTGGQKPTSTALFAREVKAAHALLSLHMQDATGSDEEMSGEERKKRKRRRASA
ncbi:hypothetical protein FE257_002443 [Aspergillus nanangensis]|uniref:HTH APSES-type domain-containing protein n=1 Tax=Aspergillus nanangensis TaxID=2582783 RepID=A0AAD4CUN5_ASPNN|nr:hypothetical protein FE257_002443 [Aspergillus nanangensis]